LKVRLEVVLKIQLRISSQCHNCVFRFSLNLRAKLMSNKINTNTDQNELVKVLDACRFSEFANDHDELWTMIVGAKIHHPKHGDGKIVNIESRSENTQYVYVRFEKPDSDEKIFTSNVFRKGIIRAINISDSMSIELQKWKDQFIRETSQTIMVSDSPKISVIFNSFGIKAFWHMTHRDNLTNIREFGILDYYEVRKRNLLSTDISDPGAQRWRDKKEPQYDRPIHSYVPLYLNPLNPMLFLRKDQQCDILLLEVDPSVLENTQFLFTDGNAASRATIFFTNFSDLKHLPWDVLGDKWWNDKDDGKRKRCAEVLVYPKVSKEYIKKIHCHIHCDMSSLEWPNVPILNSPEHYF
jgi:hypothetical protein